MAGFLASCSQYGNKVYYLTFTNEGDKEALAFFQYKKKNGSYIVHQWGKKVPPYNSSVFEIQEIDFKIPDWDYYNFEVYYNKCEMIEE